MLYNIPIRVGINLDPPLVIQLARDGWIAAVKDSSGNLEAHRLIADGTASVDGFRRFTGSELSIDGALLAGFDGAVPGLANVFVERHVALLAHATAGDWKAASDMQAAIRGLCSHLRGAACHEQLLRSGDRRTQGGVGAARHHRPCDDVPGVRTTRQRVAPTWPPCSPRRRVGRDRRTA